MKIHLLYSLIGLISSFATIALFEAVPHLRFLSNEALIFGSMFASMGLAIEPYLLDLSFKLHDKTENTSTKG